MPQRQHIGLPRLFGAFFRLGATAFGGGTAGWLYREIVQKRGWIDDQSFLAMLGIGQVMPGSNGIKMTVLIGQRLGGAAGAIVALVGLLAAPFVIILAVGVVYAGFSEYRLLHAALDGVAAAVIGLTFATGLRSVAQGSPNPAAIGIVAATVLCVGVLRWPILPVIAGLAPLSIALAWVETRRG